ncbi:hypothetical protein PVA45_03370 [Entomospira entomophila]|uniref:Uncharacterized protein n=1 Tax=Entomospira entomophila TaxID=2719988 RepID=A0A968G9U1_9SPIO|nr:hypothetical protein [Entomospira entomophilus]NIZ40552.1 hypothetical protein [Entomospira entomophilus]WDI36110.1 hypothetical protein PVA45_03370 [Entomospira entomophilus]
MKRLFLAVLMVLSVSAFGFFRSSEPSSGEQYQNFSNHNSPQIMRGVDSSIFVLWKPVSWREMFKR